VTASGTPDDVVERLAALERAGAEQLVVLPCDPDPTTAAERLFAEVVPRLPLATPVT
jgi:hypothetical protein